MRLIKNFLCLLASACLVGCQERPYSTQYLLTHPLLLKQEVEYCEKTHSDYCEMVMNMITQVITLLNEQQRYPQQFAEKLMQAESRVVKAQQLLRKPGMSTDELTQTKELLKKEQEEVETRLAIIGMNGPE